MDTAAIDAYKYKINSFNNGYIHLTIENKFHLLSYNTIVDIQSFCLANKYRFSTINITKKYLHFIIITDWTNEYDANPCNTDFTGDINWIGISNRSDIMDFEKLNLNTKPIDFLAWTIKHTNISLTIITKGYIITQITIVSMIEFAELNNLIFNSAYYDNEEIHFLFFYKSK